PLFPSSTLFRSPECKIIILTSYYDDEQVFPAIEAGAFSYILKTSSGDEIIAAIKKAMKGENVIEPKVAGKMMSGFRTDHKKLHDRLTDGQCEELGWTANGRTKK